MKKRIALLLFGLSKIKYKNWRNGYVEVDYRLSYENYIKYIYDYFQKKGYDIDVYFTTNDLNDDERKEIINLYKPIKCDFFKYNSDKKKSRNTKFVNSMKLCIESNIKYDLILITRFDLIFNKNFNESNIQLDKFNLVSILERGNLICDNFYLFPYKYLKPFYDWGKNNLNANYHWIKGVLEDLTLSEGINYILSENTKVHNLSFYDIKRNPI